MAKKEETIVENTESVETTETQQAQEVEKTKDITTKGRVFYADVDAKFDETTSFEVLRSFCISIGNYSVNGETGEIIKLSKASESQIKALISGGYIKIKE